MAISVTDPIERAIKRAKLICFQPFDLGRWFTFGFVAWLATLDEGGGSGNFNTPGGGGGGGGTGPRPPTTGPATWPMPGGPPAGTPAPTPSPANPFEQAWQWVTTHVLETALIGLAVMLLIAGIWLLVLWVSSRGKFMFIHGIATTTYEVKAPWARFRQLGNSLFAFRAGVAGVGLVAMVLIVGTSALLALPDIRAGRFGGGAVAAIIVFLVLFLPAAIIMGLVDWVTNTFVAHVMYATGQTVLPAWREFRRDVMPGNTGKLTLFLLMQILLGFGVAIGRVLVGCVTCCIGFLPYLSAVAALPLLVFMRAYPMYFFQQFSPRYMVMVEPTPPTMGFPVYPPAYPAPQYPYPPAQQYPPPQQYPPQGYPPQPPGPPPGV